MANDTPLSPEQEALFRRWLSEQSRALGRNLGNDLHDYDLRGQFADTGGAPVQPGHGTDKYKKPNHPTFSDESKYSTPQAPGGHWDETKPERWAFVPSPQMLADGLPEHSPGEMLAYFAQAEPDVELRRPPVDEWALEQARIKRERAAQAIQALVAANQRNMTPSR